MTMTAVRRWTCERCDRQQETAAEEQPRQWVAVIVVSPPLAVPHDPAYRKHLCDECADAVMAFMAATQ